MPRGATPASRAHAGRPRKDGELAGKLRLLPKKPKSEAQTLQPEVQAASAPRLNNTLKNKVYKKHAKPAETLVSAFEYAGKKPKNQPKSFELDQTSLATDNLGDEFSLAGRRDPPVPSGPMYHPTRAKYGESGRIAWVPHQMGRPVGQVLFTRPHVNLGVLAGRIYSANELGEIVVFDEQDKIELMRVHGCRETR